MKVYLGQQPMDGIGGINRVVASLYEHLPLHGIELVDTEEAADVIHAHVAVYKDYPVDKPLVVSSHGMMWEEDNWGNVGWKVNSLCVQSYIKADVVTAPSEFVARAIERNTLIYPKIVRHGIRTDRWLPGTSEGYVLWNKARLDSACRVEPLIELAKRAPNTQFVSTYGLGQPNVRITGRVSNAEMLALVQAAGVYLITPRESGGPSYGVLEAMSCAVPVLSWDYGGTAEAIRHKETGYLAREGDYEDLLAGLYYCLEHRDRLGQAARQEAIEKYDVRDTTRGYLEAYQQAVVPVPQVSVIIPCFNLGKYLPACIDSVKAQTYSNWEAIIINDASTDDSAEIADSLKDERIKVLHNPKNLHVSASRNRGIEQAAGKYILPLDADDRLTPNALADMVKVLEGSRDYQIVAGKLRLFSEGDLTRGRKGEWPNNADFELQRTGYNRLPYASMYRKKVWENIGGYRKRIRSGVEDADFWTRALSYGYRAKILDSVTLDYTMRNNSLGKQNKRGNAAWLSWFGWSSDARLAPLAAEGGPRTTLSYDSPAVSVVVPVGPGHEKYIQTIIDSLIAQDERNWELILVNDTGKAWNNHIPFARVVNSDQNRGVAWARNAGARSARAPKIVFVDADDVLQPYALSLMLKAHEKAGGWIYGDWYAAVGEKITHEKAKDWNVRELLNQSLGPITGLYEKEHINLIGGFDESAPGWEDWDFHLRLLEQGICGTRLEYPLILYNMHLGWRRENNFAKKQDLLQYIVKKHKSLYRSNNVGCSKCGGKRTLTVDKSTPVTEDTPTTMVKMAYVGPESQTRTIRSKVPGMRHVTYRFNNRKPFMVLPQDAEWLLTIKGFVKAEAPLAPAVEQEMLVPDPVAEDVLTPLEKLDVRPEVLSVLQENFSSVEDIKASSDASLLAVKGIGASRLSTIREAVENLHA